KARGGRDGDERHDQDTDPGCPSHTGTISPFATARYRAGGGGGGAPAGGWGMLGPFGVVEQRNTSASSIDISILLNEITAVLPPARTIFRRRSLMLSSLMAPTRVHPAASAGSVVRRTPVIALSSSAARAGATASHEAGVTEARRAIRQKIRVFNGATPDDRPTAIRGRSESSRPTEASSRDRPSGDHPGGVRSGAYCFVGADRPGGDRRVPATRRAP